MNNNLLPQNDFGHHLPASKGAIAEMGSKMSGHQPQHSAFGHVTKMAQAIAPPRGEQTSYHRNLRGIVANLLDDAKLALRTDRQAAEASIARASALLQGDAADEIQIKRDAPRTVARGGLAQWQIRRATAYVDANLASTISVQDLSDMTRLSRSHFSRAFKVSVGESVHAYIIRQRIERAQEMMLTTADSLCQIALACGLSDQAHFSRLFRSVVGISPNAWRRQWLRDRLDQR
jgi:AraC family transcriptional regulator